MDPRRRAFFTASAAALAAVPAHAATSKAVKPPGQLQRPVFWRRGRRQGPPQFCRIRTAGSLFALHKITDFGVHLTKGIAETEIPHAAEL